MTVVEKIAADWIEDDGTGREWYRITRRGKLVAMVNYSPQSASLGLPGYYATGDGPTTRKCHTMAEVLVAVG